MEIDCINWCSNVFVILIYQFRISTIFRPIRMSLASPFALFCCLLLSNIVKYENLGFVFRENKRVMSMSLFSKLSMYWSIKSTYICDGLRHTLLLGTLYFKVAWYTFLPNLLCSSTQSTPWHTLLLSTFYFSTHIAPWNTFFLSTLCFKEHFASKNTLLFVFQRAKYVEENILQKSKMFLWAKCSKEQSVPGSKMCCGVKCFRKQSVPGSKMCWGAKCS